MLRYHLLGPVEVVRDGRPVELGAPKQRTVLAVLLLASGRVVSTDRLIETVWGENAPPSVQAGLQAYISNLRRLLRDDTRATSPIVRRPPGYLVDIGPDELDLTAFLRDADAAQAAADAADWTAAAAAAERGLARWRGPLIAEHADEEWVRAAAVPLAETRTAARQNLVTALLGLDRVSPALRVAHELEQAQPLSERACWLHMVALHRAGLPTEALEVYRNHARTLDDELGLLPGPALRDLQGAILRQDPDLDTWPRRPDRATPGVVQPRIPDPAAAVEPAPVEPGPDPGGIVGRVRELGVVDAVLREARTEAARWLVITGEAGIGKSRLAQEAVRRWVAAGGRLARTGCPDDDGLPAWWPVRDLLRTLGLDPDVLLRPPTGVEVDEARFAVYERVLAAVAGLPATEPLLVLVDDVQWADSASLRFLTHVAEAGLPTGLVIVLTARDGAGGPEVARLLATAARRAGTRTLPVPPLSAAEVGRLAAEVNGEPLGSGEVARLAEQTAGNPFFICEYARLPAEERATGEVPVAIRSVLGLRLAALDPAALQVVRAAALIGDLLDIGLLGRVTRLDLDQLADLLDEAADERIIVTDPGGGGYAFAHALLRDEAVAGLSAMRRRRLHLAVAEAIGPQARGDRLAQRATHLLAALPLADPAEAVAACRAAALEAEQGWHSDSAAHWWAATLRAHEHQPDADPAERDELLLAQVGALGRAGRGQTVLDVVDAALLDAVRAGRLDSAGRLAAGLLRTCGCWPWAAYGTDPGPLLARLAAVEPLVRPEPAAHARILATLAVGSCYHPDPGVPDGLSARAIALAEELGDPDVLADALLGRALTYSGVAERAVECTALLDRLAALPHAQARVDDVLRHGLLTMTTFTLGDVGAAAEHVRLGAAGSDLLRLVVARAQLRWVEGALEQWRGVDLGRAEALYDHAYELHRRTELYESGVHAIAVLTLRWDQGRLAELADTGQPAGDAWMAALIAAACDAPDADDLLAAEVHRPEPTVWTTHGRLTLLAHAVADRGLAGPGEVLRGRLRPLAGCLATIGQVGIAGPVGLALARLDLLAGDLAAATEHLAVATELADRAGGAGARLRCRLLAVELAAGRGDPPDLDELSAIAAEAARGGMAGVADAARQHAGVG